MNPKKSHSKAAAKRGMKDLTPKKTSDVKVAGGKIMSETVERKTQIVQKTTS